MEITGAFAYVNWYLVLLATLATFVLGGFWYAPFGLGKFWARASGAGTGRRLDRNMPAIFVHAFVLLWLSSSLLAAVLGPNPTGMYGLNVGLLVGAFFVVTSMGVTYIFEHRPLSLLVINGAYHVVALGLAGFIIGNWT